MVNDIKYTRIDKIRDLKRGVKMGYDITLYVVEKTNSMNDGKYYAQEIARFDMCVFPELARFMADEPPTDCYFYADDGNTHVVEDRYGLR